MFLVKRTRDQWLIKSILNIDNKENYMLSFRPKQHARISTKRINGYH